MYFKVTLGEFSKFKFLLDLNVLTMFGWEKTLHWESN